MRSCTGLILALTVLAGTAHADMTPNPEFGQSLAPRDGKTLVEMTAEEVTISLGPEQAAVRAVFHLKNTGPETKLEVGFPDVVSPSTWSSNKPPEGVSRKRLRGFKAVVDGEPVAHGHRYLKAGESPFAGGKDPDEWLYGGWLVWDMTFAADQERTVEVTYWVPYRRTYRPTLLGDRHFEYILKTGAPWQGPIGRAQITVTFGGGVTKKHVEVLGPAGHALDEKGVRWDLRKLEPTEDVRIVVRSYVDLRDAARGYLERAGTYAEKGDNNAVATLLASAAICQEKTAQYEACIASCRKIILHEQEVRAKQSGAKQRFRVRRWWKDSYEPWECRIVRCLVKQSRMEEARTEAAAAIEALRAYREEARAYRYAHPEKIDERIAAYEAFAKGGEFKD